MTLTLNEDFSPWWNLPKYRNKEIPAKQYSNEIVVEQMAGNRGWPGPETDVKYWVKLANGKAVGFRHPRTEKGRYKKHAEFPVYNFIK